MNIIRVSESLSPRTSDQTYQSFFSSIFPIFHPLRDINFGAIFDEYGCWGDEGGSIFHRSRRPDPENLEAQCISVVCRRSILSTKLLPTEEFQLAYIVTIVMLRILFIRICAVGN